MSNVLYAVTVVIVAQISLIHTSPFCVCVGLLAVWLVIVHPSSTVPYSFPAPEAGASLSLSSPSCPPISSSVRPSVRPGVSSSSSPLLPPTLLTPLPLLRPTHYFPLFHATDPFLLFLALSVIFFVIRRRFSRTRSRGSTVFVKAPDFSKNFIIAYFPVLLLSSAFSYYMVPRLEWFSAWALFPFVRYKSGVVLNDKFVFRSALCQPAEYLPWGFPHVFPRFPRGWEFVRLLKAARGGCSDPLSSQLFHRFFLRPSSRVR
ncbi:hypothetical protein H2248_010239 [Termitomyces sp. 'cryptogamus']|nr:hypothetical protein H2248_010239 [Termitomyces sp. 'cryptogamus']